MGDYSLRFSCRDCGAWAGKPCRDHGPKYPSDRRRSPPHRDRLERSLRFSFQVPEPVACALAERAGPMSDYIMDVRPREPGERRAKPARGRRAL